jgi:hypothetical protein
MRYTYLGHTGVSPVLPFFEVCSMIRLVAAVALILLAGCTVALTPTHELRWAPVDTPARPSEISASADVPDRGDLIP